MEMNWMLIFVFGMAVIMLIMPLIEGKMRKNLMNELADLMMTGKFAEFDEKINLRKTRRLIRPFNLDYMKLNCAIMKGDQEAVEKCFDRFDQVRLNTEQKSAVYMRGFYYYLTLEDLKKTELYYKKMAENRVEDCNEEIERLYDTYVLGGIKYLRQTEEALKQASENEKPALEALLVKLYENKGDSKLAEEYEKRFKSHFDK